MQCCVPSAVILCLRLPSDIVVWTTLVRQHTNFNMMICRGVLHLILDMSIAQQLRDARGDLKLASRRVVVLSRQWVLKEDDRATALAIYMLSKGELALVFKYLRCIGGQRHWPHVCDDALTWLVTREFRDATDEYLISLTDAGVTAFPKALARAYGYLQKWVACGWNHAENLEGHNVYSSNVLLHIEEQRVQIPECVRPESWGWPRSSKSASREFVRRWRNAYTGRMGKLLPRATDFSVEDFQVKARAAWQWYNHLAGRVAPGKRVLRVNLDETALSLHQGGRRGNIFLSKGHDATERISKSARRAYVTHVAFVCDDEVLQELLPQVIICNERTMPKAKITALRERLGNKFVLIRAPSAWVNTDICVMLVRLLAEALHPYRDLLQIILMLDAYRAHIGVRVWNAAVRHSVWILVIPAGLTWLLQVLDTHGFRSYKDHVYTSHQLHCIRNRWEPGSLEALFDAVKEATRSCLCGKGWAIAFDGNGFGDSQRRVRERVCKALGNMEIGVIPSSRPSMEQVKVCLPRRAKVFYKAIWRPVDAPVSDDKPACSSASPALVATGPIIVTSSSSSSSTYGLVAAPPIAARTRSHIAKAKAKATAKCDIFT